MSDIDFDRFFDKLEKHEKETLQKMDASVLLRMSANPFDIACIKVKELEKENAEMKSDIQELAKALIISKGQWIHSVNSIQCLKAFRIAMKYILIPGK